MNTSNITFDRIEDNVIPNCIYKIINPVLIERLSPNRKYN